MLLSLPANAGRILHAIRSHSRIENSMHWVLDVAIGEGRSHVGRERGAELRHPARYYHETTQARYGHI